MIVSDASDTEWVAADLIQCPDLVDSDDAAPARPAESLGAQRLARAVETISLRSSLAEVYGAEPWPGWLSATFEDCADGERVRAVDVEAADGSVIGITAPAPCDGLPGE